MAIPTVTNSALQRTNVSATSDATLTLSSNSGRVLVAWLQFYDTAQTQTGSAVTFAPGTGDEASFTNEAGATATNDWSGNRHRSEVWYLVLDNGVSSGSYTVRATFSGTVARACIQVWEVDGADTTDPIGASGNATGNAADSEVSVTTTATNSLVAAGVIDQNNANFTPGSGDTEVLDDASNLASLWSGYTGAATTGSYTVGANNGIKEWAMSGVEILEASAGGPDYTLTAAAGSLDHTGTATGLLASRLLTAAARAMSLSQLSIVNLIVSRLLTAEAGARTFTGRPAGLIVHRKLTAEAGTISLTGTATGLTVSRVLTAEAGALTFTGPDVTLTYPAPSADYILTAEAGTINFTGTAAGFTVSRLLTAEARALTFTGVAADFQLTRKLTAEAGSFTFTGPATTLTVTRVLVAGPGSITFTGIAAGLSYSGEQAELILLTLQCNPSPIITLSSNPTPAADLECNPSPAVTLENA